MAIFISYVLAAFLASLVEAVEALTIVLAAGVSKGFKSALEGALSAVVVLVVITGAFGIAIIRYVPINVLRVVVGGYLLIFGLSWYKKAILRASGFKKKHDEDEIFELEVQLLSKEEALGAREHSVFNIGFNTAFKGVLLEGLEIVIIVISLGAQSRKLLPVSLGALGAAFLVSAVGFVLKRQLSKVPENAIKSIVGVMLVSFGTFWAGEGLGIKWYFKDGFILILIALNISLFLLLVALSKRRRLSKAI